MASADETLDDVREEAELASVFITAYVPSKRWPFTTSMYYKIAVYNVQYADHHRDPSAPGLFVIISRCRLIIIMMSKDRQQLSQSHLKWQNLKRRSDCEETGYIKNRNH